jgi:hypothetical protein
MCAHSAHIQPIARLDGLAHEEALHALDPLRHYFQSHDEILDQADALFPTQASPAAKEIVEFCFGANISPSPHSPLARISINLAVDASPGCGGVAWPAGQVNFHSSSECSFEVHQKSPYVSDIQVLAEYIVMLGPEFMMGRTILELGSGTGLVGLVCGALGAKAVWITDQAFVFRVLELSFRGIMTFQLSRCAIALSWTSCIATFFSINSHLT